MTNEEIKAKVKEIREIEADIHTMCELHMIECIDLIYIAHRINDLKQDIRILKARDL